MEIWDAYNSEYEKIEGMTLIRGEEASIPEGVYHLVCHILVEHVDGTFLLMQRDPRKAYPNMWEATAGGSALKGETAEECAYRELREETGFSGKLVKLCELPGSQGTSIEMAYIYLALCDSRHASITEPTELIEVKTMPEAEFGELVHKGRLRQLAGIVAWYYYELRKGDGFDA